MKAMHGHKPHRPGGPLKIEASNPSVATPQEIEPGIFSKHSVYPTCAQDPFWLRDVTFRDPRGAFVIVMRVWGVALT